MVSQSLCGEQAERHAHAAAPLGRCPLPEVPEEVTPEARRVLEEAGCMLLQAAGDRRQFDSLLAELSTNALARQRADETLQAREASLRQSQEDLRALAARLVDAQEEERRHLAREMHDDWTQRLAVLGLDLARLEKSLANPADALVLLRTMRQQLVELSEDVHDLSRQLHPSILDDLGLVEALGSECAAFNRREDIAVEYRPRNLPPGLRRDVALCLYRVAQEALRNVAKHAAVTTVQVELEGTAEEVTLRIRDRGVGFEPAGPRHHQGLGLSSIGERCRLIEAKVSITSSPGEGTQVEVRVPLRGGAP